MCGFIFIIMIDWVMKKTLDKRRGLLWNLTTVPEDLNYVDIITLLSSIHSDSQEMTSRFHRVGKEVGLNINPSKTMIMHLNCKKNYLITVGDNALDDIETFTYLLYGVEMGT